MGRPGDYVIVVIHSVCEQDYWKNNEPISVKIGAVIGPIYRKNWLAFGGASVPGECGFQITCPFSSPMRKGILGDLLAFLIHYRQFFYKTWRNDWCRQGNESTTFWERSGRHPNPGSFLVDISALAAVCALWALCIYSHNLTLIILNFFVIMTIVILLINIV